MINKSMVMLSVVFALIAGTARAQNYGLPGDYLVEIPSDAAAFATGGGSVASTTNRGGPFMNPATLGRSGYMDLVAYYQRLFEGFHAYSSAFSYPFGKFGVVGLAMMGVASPEAPVLDQWGIERGTFRATDNTFLLSYGKMLRPWIGLGASFKIATQSVDTYRDLGVGFDAGVLVHPIQWVTVGVSAVNLGGPVIRLKTTDDIFTTALRSGVGVSVLDRRLRFNADLDVLEIVPHEKAYASGEVSRPLRWRVGIEGRLFRYFALRGGVNDRMFSLGTGFRVKWVEADYGIGYHNDRSDLNQGLTHAFSIRYSFGKPLPKEEEELIAKAREMERRANLHEAQRLYIEGFPVEARKLIAEHVAAHPQDEPAAELLAKVEKDLAAGKVGDLVSKVGNALAKQDYGRAEKLVSEALEISPNHEEANKLKERLLILTENQRRLEDIRKLYAQEQFEKMAKKLDVVLSLDSSNAEALKYKEKIAGFVKKRTADEHYNLASTYYHEQGDVEKANAELQKALDAYPDHKEAKALYEKISGQIKQMYLKKVGQIVDKQGLEVDNEDLRKLIQMDIQDRLVRARKLLEQQDCGEALGAIEAVLSDSATHDEALQLKKEAQECRKDKEAAVAYSEALKLYNEDKLSEAEAEAAKAADLDPEHEKATGLLTDIRQKQRARNLAEAREKLASENREELTAARKMVEEYLAVDQDSDEAKALLANIQAELLVLEANEFIDQGEFEKADQAIQKALKLDPDNKKVQDAFKNLREVLDVFTE